MDLVYRVNPPNVPNIPIMDSKNPEGFSLKYKKFYNIKNAPIEFLKCINGSSELLYLEKIREAHYPHLPSRLTSIFAFDNLEEAKKFKQSGWTEKDGLISCYRVTNLYSPIFIGDMSITNILSNLPKHWDEFKNKTAPFIKNTLEESLDAVCHLYWQKKLSWPAHFLREVLIDGTIEILPYVKLN